MSKDAAALLAAIAIDRSSSEPVFRQIARRIHDLVVGGDLRSGAVLPAEREFARSLGVGRATVARALTDLADTGLLERRVGHGTVVAFDLESWRAGPTAGIPWGALLATLAPLLVSRREDSHAASRREQVAATLEVFDRGAESILLTAGRGDGTRFLVSALLSDGDRAIVEGPVSPLLRTVLAMQGAALIEVGGTHGAFTIDLERLLEAKPGAKLLWLQASWPSRSRGDRAHLAGLTKGFGLPVIEEQSGRRPAAGLLEVEPHDHVLRLEERWISAPLALARLLRPLARVLQVGPASDG